MAAILILSLALFSGAASAFKLEDVAIASNGTSNATTLHQFPSLVQVEAYNYWTSGQWQQTCAASILNELNVLTAASCFSGWNYPGAHARRIRAGSHARGAGGVVVYVNRATNYRQNSTVATAFYDISVVRLQHHLFLGNLIQQARILQQGSVIPRNAVVNQVGWGRRNDTNVALSTALVYTFPEATNQTLPSNATSNLIRGIPSYNARWNGDVGGPWIWGTITVGVISANNLYSNGTVITATTISAFTNWILRTV